MAARLDVRTWTALPAAGSALDARQALDVGRAARRADLGRRSRGVRRSTLRQALSCARVIRIFLGQPCRTALLWVWVGEATWPVAGLLHRPRRRYRARSRTGGGQGRSGSTCGPWTALPGGKALDASPGARRGPRGSTCGLGRRSRPGSRALDASPGARRGSAARRADLPGRRSRPGSRALDARPGARRGSAARRADLGRRSRPRGRRSTWAARLDVRRGAAHGRVDQSAADTGPPGGPRNDDRHSGRPTAWGHWPATTHH